MSSAVASLQRALLVCCAASVLAGSATAQAKRTRRPTGPDWSAVENALGRKGTPSPGGIARFSFPRSDLNVVVHGITLKPALALGSWVAFKRIADHAMVMGDLVLLDGEVTTVMASLQQNGVDQQQVTQVRGFADQRLRKPDAPLDPSNRRISLIVHYLDTDTKQEIPGFPAGTKAETDYGNRQRRRASL